MQQVRDYDVLIIGSGAAGLCAALQLPSYLKVAVISKTLAVAGSTARAQGGIAAVLDAEDSLESHIQDTLVAGAGLCHKDAVAFTVENSRAAINWLIGQQVPFTPQDAGTTSYDYHLTREGGHSHRRVIHAADATGFVLSTRLVDVARQRSNINLLEQRLAVDLIVNNHPVTGERRCMGAYVLNLGSDQVELFRARFVILATGGASKTYLYTSNVDSSSGDGIAMAWRAGCRISNLEFNQFHPTCLYHPHAQSVLISEAVRGEGGILTLADGSRFMDKHDPRGELAPRDIVARAIDFEMKRCGIESVFLDISHKSKAFITKHFPTIYESCLQYGIDMSKEPIPVVPSAHYTCGGVVVDHHGQTDIPGLFAIGETSCTGLHGANRLASNSLLECVVYARSSVQMITRQLDTTPAPVELPHWDASQVTDSDEDVVIIHNWDELRRFMWDYVGIVRTSKRLLRAQNRITMLQDEIHEFYSNYKISNDLIELRNLALVAELIIRCALARKESRGLHYTLDYPEQNPDSQDTVLTPPNYQHRISAPHR